MPTYTYKCPHHEFDEVRKISDRDAPIFCPCGAPAERVEISGAPSYVAHPGVGNKSRFSRDRAGK